MKCTLFDNTRNTDTMDLTEAEAELVKLRGRKFRVAAFGLLQTQNIRLLFLQIARDEPDAQPHRIDVPCRDGEAQESLPVVARGADNGDFRRRCKVARALAHK